MCGKMSWSGLRKRLHKRSFDLLSQRYGILFILLAAASIIIAIIHFGETVVLWSSEKYAAVFNSFSDNLIDVSFRSRLCLPVPIDIVYTWVNGSDPTLLDNLQTYRRVLLSEMNAESNASTQVKCDFESCVLAGGLVIDPAVTSETDLLLLQNVRTVYSTNDPVTGHNVTVILFNGLDDAELGAMVNLGGNSHTSLVRRLYYTTDRTLPSAVTSTDVLIMTGFPDMDTKEHLLEAIPVEYRNVITHALLYQDRGIAALTVPDVNAITALLTFKNITISGKSPTFSMARLVWDLTDYQKYEAISASRFEDNDELRYSLRSVERHAPWVRHIYIVTNGQIPSWLNLDNKRVSIVTHTEIFSNSSHLPSFSSPAIESHLHRINGLSEYFIYMNDDVMFGKDVWPDDFVSASGSQKVYLTYPVPNCREGCPSSWISDGYCDRACNNSQCDWDGGDCSGANVRSQYPVYGAGAGGGGGGLGQYGARSSSLYCNPGCANNWIADRYCDQACNVRTCAFDAGDCGTGDYHFLHRFDLTAEKVVYDARGHMMFYFNLSSVLGGENGRISGGLVEKDDKIRSVSIARKFKVLTVLLHANQSECSLEFTLSLTNHYQNNVTVNFTVIIETEHILNGTVQNVSSVTVSDEPPSSPATYMSDAFEADFVSLKSQDRYPKPKFLQQNGTLVNAVDDIGQYDLPADIRHDYDELSSQLREGDLTESGYAWLMSSLWTKYLKHVEDLGRKPALLNTAEISTITPGAATYNNTSNAQGFTEHIERLQTSGKSKQGLPRKHATARRTLLSVDYDENGPSSSLEFSSLEDSLSHASDAAGFVSDGFLPWEKKGIFTDLQNEIKRTKARNAYLTDAGIGKRRHLLDTYADSLRHVSQIYNKAYGYVARRVPAHMPHMIHRRIMHALQSRFPEAWSLTSSHRIRQADDMQYAFSYYYFLMSERVNASVAEIFEEVDADHSGILSDRELRVLATRIFELPLDLKVLQGFEQLLINCSESNLTNVELRGQSVDRSSTMKPEVYYEKRLPQIARSLITGCQAAVELITKHTKTRTKYKHEVISEDSDIYFKMLTANVSRVVAILDEVRRDMRKFICLNDNIDYQQESAKVVRVIMRDFYESFFPTPSQFELPKQYRNRFLHVDELHDWWYFRKWLRIGAQVVLIVAVAFALLSFLFDRVRSVKRLMFGRS